MTHWLTQLREDIENAWERCLILAVVSGWKWPRRVEAWAWNKADYLPEEETE